MGNSESLWNQSVEASVSAPPNDLRSPPPSINEGGGHVNKFLLCTLVCGMAREIKARAAESGRTLPLLRVVRNVLRSHLENLPVETGLSTEGQLLDEEALRSEIERQLQEHLKPSLKHQAEERQLDLEAITAAIAAKHNDETVNRRWLANAR